MATPEGENKHKEKANPTSINPQDRETICQFYDIDVGAFVQNKSGLVNTTFELDDQFFLTIYQDRTPTELEAVAQLANDMNSSIPIARPKKGNTGGFTVQTQHGAAMLTLRLPGIHYVGSTHTEKYPLPRELHYSLAEFFWSFQGELLTAPDDLKEILKTASRETIGKMPEQIPNIAKPLEKYAPDEMPIFKYPALIHDDLERQNILSMDSKITGIVDLDSIHSGDILYEFGHFLFNNVFCDPEVNTETVMLYLSKLISSGIINPADIPLLYGYTYQFAISDIVDFQDLIETTQQEIIDIELLVAQYEEALSFASDFFNTGQPRSNSQ